LKLILSYMKPHRAPALCGILIKIISTFVLLLIPFVLEHVVDNVVPTRNLAAVLLWGLVMVLLAVLERSMNLKSNRISIKVAKNSIFTLRQDLFARSIDLSGSQVDRFGLPSLTSRLTNDVYNVQGFMQNLQTFAFRAPILILGSIVLTLIMDPGLALILCILAPIMVAAVALVSIKGIPLFGAIQRNVDAATRILRENITGVRVVKALSKEDYETRRFEAANETVTHSETKAGSIMSLPGPVSTLFLNIGLVIIVLVGAKRVDGGITQPGTILAFLTYFNMILMGVMGLNHIFMMLSKANASAKRIAAVMNEPEALPVLSTEQAACTKDSGFIVFDRVSFRYGEEKSAARDEQFDGETQQMSLSDISFSLKKGDSLGIIGPTGSGKTTLINLLMRFYDATDGAVFVDGKDVRTYDKDTLRRRFGAVFQSDTIFADTLEENISFGRALSSDAVAHAARNAMAIEFIEAYEDGYHHRVAAHGTDLSGGQKQRVLIARALADAPEILILDDASSALDYRTDAALRRAIQEHHSAATTIIVAQRISSIMDCDEILMLDEGRIIGRGTHDQLLSTCPQYLDIYKAQMGEEV